MKGETSMNIQVKFRNVKKSSAAIMQVSNRLFLAFARTKEAIQSVSIIISDVNGPKGGVDKLCRILIKSAHLPDIVITENQTSTSAAIDRCIARARQNLSRQIKKNKQSLQQRMKLQHLLPTSNDDIAYPTA
jgi:putative sigma-54 modulation protein